MLNKIIIIVIIFSISKNCLVNSKLIKMSSYSNIPEVHKDKIENNTETEPKIYKALHTNLWFPKVLQSPIKLENSGMNNGNEQTGRAASDSLSFPIFHLSESPAPVYVPEKDPLTLYPTTGQNKKFFQKDQAMDRYSPGEAVASNLFKQRKPSNLYIPSAKKQEFNTPPINLYNFPPNINSKYNLESQNKTLVNSYSAPPSGPVIENNMNFVGPFNPDKFSKNVEKNNIMNSTEKNKDTLLLDEKDELFEYKPELHSAEYENIDEPKPTFIKSSPNQMSSFWDSSPLKYGSSGISHFPEIIVDYNPHHEYSKDHHIITPTPTTEPPQQGRVKKYSYFYIGRKLWYIPLYFTIWFSFYILFLILKSIARHTVSLPNHVQHRRNIRNELNSEYDPFSEKTDFLANFVKMQIDSFIQKYRK